MKSKLMFFSRCRFAGPGWLVGLALLTWGSASGQNLVRNPDFEEPLGPDNWTIVYTGVVNPTTASYPSECGPSDFYICGRTRLAHKDMVPGTWDGDDGTGTNYWNKFGLEFCASHDWLMHAYAKQVVSGLTPYAQYAVSAWITQFDPNAAVAKIQLYMEVLGGPTGTTSKRTPYVTTTVLGTPENWTSYWVTNTASSAGTMEIRLHYNKNGATTGEKWRNLYGFFDHVNLMLVTQPEYTPPYMIVAFERTNQDIVLQWETVMNNKYRIQVSKDLADPYSWTWVERALNLDTNLAATGTSFTFATNLVSLFSYDPNFDPDAPLFFRIYSEPFVP